MPLYRHAAHEFMPQWTIDKVSAGGLEHAPIGQREDYSLGGLVGYTKLAQLSKEAFFDLYRCQIIA